MENFDHDTTQPGEDILTDISGHLVAASTGKRFANYLIDLALFYFLAMLVGIVIALVSPSTIESLNDDSTSFALIDKIVSMIMYGLYMGVMEGLFKGKTLGKLITKTRAVNDDGSRISWATALKRGFCRVVPFEPLSGFSGYPWHDKWSETLVVDEKISFSTPE